MRSDATSRSGNDRNVALRVALPASTVLALLSASCCVLPIGLSILGLGGTWLMVLEPFVAYRAALLTFVAVVLLLSWWRILRPPACARRKSSAMIWAGIATGAFAVAATSPLWEGHANRYMWALWRSTQ